MGQWVDVGDELTTTIRLDKSPQSPPQKLVKATRRTRTAMPQSSGIHRPPRDSIAYQTISESGLAAWRSPRSDPFHFSLPLNHVARAAISEERDTDKPIQAEEASK